MRKILFTFLFAIVVSLGTLFAESGTCGYYLTWDLTDGVLTISGKGAMTNYPSSRAPWYDYRTSINSVVMEEGVKSIGNYAFNACSGLTSVEIPSSVTSIGNWAFSYCRSLTSVEIPSSVTSIGSSAFYNCSSLTSIEIPNSVTSIGESAFENCSGLTSVTIGNSVTSIGESAFRNCTGLTSVTIPNSVTSIGRSAFYGCSSLTSVTIPNSVTSIGEFTFSGCSSLTSVTIPNSVTSIGESAFENCSGLKSVTIGNSVTSIGIEAFYACYRLTSVTIGNSVTSIGGSAFQYCYRLTSVTIPNSVTSIGAWAFYGCSGLTSVTIPNSVTSIGYEAFENVYNIVYSGTATGSPWGATYINKIVDGLFVYNDEDKTHLIECHSSAARTITIPNSVSYIEKDAFANCANIDTVIWNAVFCEDFEYSPFYSSRNNLKAFIVSDGVQRIPANLCRGLQCMQDFTIPSTVSYIGRNAFYESNLNEISIPNTIEHVGERAFGNCPLTKVHWDVANQSDYAVIGEDNGCITVSLDASNLDWDQVYLHAWTHYERILDAWPGKQIQKDENGRYSYTFPASYSYVNIIWNNGSDQTVDITNVTSSTIYTLTSSRGTSIGYTTRELEGNLDAPFYGSTDDILQFTFGNNVSRVPAQLCRDMKNITTVELPAKLSTIGKAAFKNCSKLESITLRENITEYGDEAFSGCNSLTSIYNYRERPAKLGTNIFADVDYFNCTLYVLAGSVDMYKSSGSDWKDFYFVKPIGAASIITENIQVTPLENTAEIAWPAVSGAATYELVIKDKSGNIVCTLAFNANGQLTSIAFAAPAREDAMQQTQAAGFSFTVTGLKEGTGYDMTLNAKNNSGTILKTETISFYTNGPEGLEDILSTEKATKFLRNNQILILRGDKTYTLTGQEVK